MIPTDQYTKRELRVAEALLANALRDVGDDRWARYFRMCLTRCLHRGLSGAELERLSTGACTIGRGIAGGPLEVIWQRGVPEDLQSAKPCHGPSKRPLAPGIFLPIDCGRCPPCEARAAIVDGLGDVPRETATT